MFASDATSAACDGFVGPGERLRTMCRPVLSMARRICRISLDLVRMVGDAVHLEEVDAPAGVLLEQRVIPGLTGGVVLARPSWSGPTGRHRWCPRRRWRESSNPRWAGCARPRRAGCRARCGCRTSSPCAWTQSASGLKLVSSIVAASFGSHATRLRDDTNSVLFADGNRAGTGT